MAEQISKTFPFDQHFYALHYLSVRMLKEKYGDNIEIINGQYSDTIFSYGSSDQSFAHIYTNILFKSKLRFRKILELIFKKKHGQNYFLPKNELEYYIGFFDHFKYMPVLSKNENESYYNYLSKLLNPLIQKYNCKSLELLFKLYGHIQGPDNQTVIKSGLDIGVNKVFLPYSNPNIIYNTIKYKSRFVEMFFAKYPVNMLINRKFKGKLKEYKDFKFTPDILGNLSTIDYNPRILIRENAKLLKTKV